MIFSMGRWSPLRDQRIPPAALTAAMERVHAAEAAALSAAGTDPHPQKVRGAAPATGAEQEDRMW
ncbi:MAG TPA: hypothetical protein VEZ44_10875 [bacterium]|nr:hypothetical protein [bacterium]